jgi:hypothetical protein
MVDRLQVLILLNTKRFVTQASLGFNSIISRLPFDNLGVAILTNDGLFGGVIGDVIRFRLLDDALGLERVDWNTRYTLKCHSPTTLLRY